MEKLLFDEKNHAYSIDGIIIPSVTQIISILSDFSFIDKDYLDQKADFGSKVHLTTELFDNDNLDEQSLHPTLSKYLSIYKKFRSDYNFRPLHIELMQYHELYRYAGKIDRIGTMKLKNKEVLALIDIKTGKPHHSHAIQTAGYMELYNYSRDKKEQVKTRIALYINEENYSIKEFNNDNDRKVFLSCLTIHNYLNQQKKG